MAWKDFTLCSNRTSLDYSSESAAGNEKMPSNGLRRLTEALEHTASAITWPRVMH